MKKNNILNYYTFLGNNIKMTVLSDPEIRKEFISFFRALRKIAAPVFTELNLSSDATEAEQEMNKQILEEEITEELPKIKEETLFTIFADCNLDLPVLALINDFEPFISD